MGKIKKILENELVGGTQTTDVYPVTSIKAVYDEDNERLDNIINRRGIVNISTNYNSDHIAEVLTLSQAIAKVPSKDRVLGFQGKFLTSEGWKSYMFTGDSLSNWTDATKWIEQITSATLAQELGNSSTKAISQEAVTNEINTLNSNTGVSEYEEFSEEKSYIIGDIVIKGGYLKEFTADHPSGAWIGTDTKDVSLKEINNTKFSELESKDNSLTLIVGKEANIKVGWINANGQILTNRGLYTEIAVEEGDTFSYYGSYGGACAGYIIYDNNNFILVKKEKADLGNISEDIEIPENGVLLKACSFTDTFNITYKGSIKEKIDKLINLSSNLSLYPLNPTNSVKGKFVSTNGTLYAKEEASYLEFLIKEGDVISYEGSYGAKCAGIAYYDVNNTLISVEQKENLGSIKTEFTAPANVYKAIASTFRNNLIVYYKNGLRGVLNEKLKTDDFSKYYHYQSLYEKFDYSKLTFNTRDIAVNQAVLFSAWVPKAGHENDEIYIIALSAYQDKSLDTQEPTRYDIWVYNQTVRVDVLQYINKTPSTQDRYHIVYKDTEYGTLYMIVDTSILAPYKENNKYKAIIWGQREYKIKTRDANDPFLSDTLWNKEDVPVTKDYKIVWFGTSIPAGGYPLIVGALLGCTVYNEAVGESLVRLGWGKNCIAEGDEIDKWGCSGTDTSAFNPMSNTIAALAKSMSASKVEKQYLIDNLAHFERITGGVLNRETYTDAVIMGYSYEEKLLKYIDSSREDYTPVDLIVFDHGHNDLNPDGDPRWDTYDIANRDKDNYWGAMNFLMDIIRKYNPHQNVCQISHYQGNVDYSANFYKAQQQFAEHWGIPFMELYKLTQMSTSEQVRTSGYWGYTDGVWHNEGFIFIDNGDGTYTTNQSCIIQYDFGIDNGTYNSNTQLFTTNVLEELPANTTARDIKTIDGVTTCLLKPREMYMKDRLHPISDKSGNANNRIATLLACWLRSVFIID